MSRTARIDAAAVLALFLFALGFRVGMLTYTHYDGLYGLDAYAYFDYTVELRRALLSGHAPPPFYWPLGYPVLCLLVSLLTGPTALAGQAASVVCGSLCPPLLYTLTLQCRPGARAGAFLAALLLAVAYYSVSQSLSFMSDLPALSWALLAANAMLAYARTLRRRWLALAAFALAAALLTRWVYALLVVPLGAAALVAYAQQRVPVRRVAAHALLAVGIGGALLALHFAPTLLRNDAKMAYAGNLRDYAWSPANFFRREFDTNDGHMAWPMPPAQVYLQPLYDDRYIRPVFTPLLFIGLVALCRRSPRPAAVLTTAWALTFYLFFAGIYMQNNRFPLSYFPPLLVAFALGLEAVAGFLAFVIGGRTRIAYGVVAVACVLLALPGVKRTIDDTWWTHTRVFAEAKDDARWAGELVPGDKVILAQGNSMVLSHTIAQQVIDLYNLSEEERDSILQRDGVVYLMVDLQAIQKQWTYHRPMQHLDWFRAHTRLTELATRHRYHLIKAELP